MMTEHCGIDWEDAFANSAYIPGGESYPDLWQARAAHFRSSARGDLDMPYGHHPRERLDIFHPSGASRGLAFFVHGGYWLSFDKSSWSDLAEGALARGWTVALPSYPLAPEAGIDDMTRHIGRALAFAAGFVSGPIRLAGHSAGGHLVTRMVCDDAPLPFAVAQRIERVVSISGVHDLRPLRLNSMNETLKLSGETAFTESPAMHAPLTGPQVIAWTGGAERPEFLRQAAFLIEAWKRKGAVARLVIEPDRHHFDVIDGLKDPHHPLAEAFAG